MVEGKFVKINIVKFSYMLVLCLLVAGISMANKSYESEKWGIVNAEFKVKGKISQPFNIIFGATLRHEDGQSIDLPGFYNDNNTWLFRFSPSKEGMWTYNTYSSHPSLANQKGTITVKPNSKSDRHGPIVISDENKQKMAYADGTPYFMLAFEIDWLFALDWDNATGIPKTKEIVGHIKDNKFNQVVMNVYAYDATWGEKDKIDPKHNYAEPNTFPFGGSNKNPDHSTLNVDFFKHLDRVMDHLNEEEIISHFMIYVWNKKVNWPKPGSKEDNLFYEYVVKRYQAYPNLIWDVSKEALAYGMDDMDYITERIERLRGLDAHKRLLSVHDYNYCRSYPDKVDFISIQEWRPNIYNEMLKAKNRHSTQPIFNIEHGGYEKTMHSIFNGSYVDPLVCLDRNYQCVFAGTYSTYYWQNTSWYEVITDPFSLEKSKQPFFHYYKHLASLFEDYDFNKLEPKQYMFSPFCLTDEATVYMFYMNEGMYSIEGQVPSLKGKTTKIKWFDPLTGEYTDAGTRKSDEGTWVGLRRPASLKSPFVIAIMEVQ